jgi:hypothetical protein
MFFRIYTISLSLFLISFLTITFNFGIINNSLIIKLLNYSFWYFLGLFSALYLIRKLKLNKEDPQDEG